MELDKEKPSKRSPVFHRTFHRSTGSCPGCIILVKTVIAVIGKTLTMCISAGVQSRKADVVIISKSELLMELPPYQSSRATPIHTL